MTIIFFCNICVEEILAGNRSLGTLDSIEVIEVWGKSIFLKQGNNMPKIS